MFYSAAVKLDERAHLHDALSTALHFSSGERHGSFLHPQRQEAERAAASVDVSRAIPLVMPRSLYIFAGLLLLAASLIGIRYGILHTLDLHRPLTEAFFEDQAAKRPSDARQSDRAAQQKQRLGDAEALLAKMGLPTNPEDPNSADQLDQAIEQALQAPAGDAAAKGQKADGATKGSQQAPAGDPMDNQANDGKADDNNSGKDAPGNQKGDGKSGSAGDNASLLSKLKDAVSNILSKSSQGDKGQMGENQQAQGGKSEKGKSDKTGGKGQEANQGAEAQDGEPNGQAQEGQQAQGKSASKGSQQSAEAGSGMGSQDGAKELRAAEQLKAMGKISEIIGKRSASVSGETTIEVQSGNQQLRTAYSKTPANHSESDGDVTRDEIPVSLQPYVQKYFQQVRKTAPPKKAAQ